MMIGIDAVNHYTSLTQSDLAALETLLASGRLEVEYESAGERRRVKFNNTAHLLTAIDYVRRALTNASATPRPVTLVEFDRGC